MPLATFSKILDQLQHSPLPTLNFTGLGEPLLNPKILDMVTEAKSRGFRAGFISNFSLVNQDIITSLIDAQLDYLQVSLDGSSKTASENIRRNSQFEKTLEKIKAFVNAKTETGSSLPTLTVLSTITEENVDEVFSLVNLAKSIGVDEIRFALAHGPNVYKPLSANSWKNSLTSKLGEGSEEEGLSCLRGVYITFDGRVLPCPHLMQVIPRTEYSNYQMGNIHQNSLSEIWFSRKYRYFRLLRVLGRRCKKCPSKYGCHHKVF
jgi:radical SAM protein with 4Fe4S-binding SPASM domain